MAAKGRALGGLPEEVGQDAVVVLIDALIDVIAGLIAPSDGVPEADRRRSLGRRDVPADEWIDIHENGMTPHARRTLGNTYARNRAGATCCKGLGPARGGVTHFADSALCAHARIQ